MTSIEWTHAPGMKGETWNPLAGCTPVSAGCLNCYAATMANRLHGMTLAGRKVPGYEGSPLTKTKDGRQVFNGLVRMIPEKLTQPLRWRDPRMVFVNSMSDLFHESVLDAYIDRVFAVMALTPQHIYQVLTKRPERMAEYLLTHGRADAIAYAARSVLSPEDRPSARENIKLAGWPFPNVWLGTSVEDQAADARILHLMRCPTAVRFLSCEPLLGEAVFRKRRSPEVGFAEALNGPVPAGIHWVIVGGESGPNSRPCDVAWIRSIVEQCQQASVPVFVKQLGARPVAAGRPIKLNDRKGGDPSEWPEDLRVREWPKGVTHE